jgi:hypothetical protein
VLSLRPDGIFLLRRTYLEAADGRDEHFHEIRSTLHCDLARAEHFDPVADTFRRRGTYVPGERCPAAPSSE